MNYLCICFKIFVCLLLNICVSDFKYPMSNVQDENVQGNVGDKWSSVQENGGRCTAPDFCRSNYLCICFRIFVCLLLNICVSALNICVFAFKYFCCCFKICFDKWISVQENRGRCTATDFCRSNQLLSHFSAFNDPADLY